MSPQKEKKAVLVTGGAGYIGSHTCKSLHLSGYLPVAYDNLRMGHEWAVQWGPLEKGDIRERARLLEVLKEYKPVAVIHLAASAYVGESVKDPLKYYRNNVAGTITLLEAMRELGPDLMVFSSSCAVYGLPTTSPIPEGHPRAPVNPYGMTKLIVERILKDSERAYGLKHLSLRYFNAAGADPELETGELHEPETHLIPLVLMAAAGLKPDVTVFGNDYPTPDGTCIRDYIHVSDLARGHVSALEYLESGASSAAFNLGAGRGSSVIEVIAVAKEVTGREITVRQGPKRPGDPPVLVAEAERAREALGWRPALSDLETIIRTAWGWTQKAHGS